MGYRMSLSCGCEEEHYFLELDGGFASVIWIDNGGVLKGLGIASLASIGVADEDEEEEHVAIDPDAWLDRLAQHRAAIREKLPEGRRKVWNETEFQRELSAFRELGEHAREAGTSVEAGWA
jgi:hypothetical protein